MVDHQFSYITNMEKKKKKKKKKHGGRFSPCYGMILQAELAIRGTLHSGSSPDFNAVPNGISHNLLVLKCSIQRGKDLHVCEREDLKTGLGSLNLPTYPRQTNN